MNQGQGFWKWLIRAGDPVTTTTRFIIATAAAVILSAAILGYTALFDLFVSIGLFWWPLAIFFPLLFDLAEVTAAVSVFNAKLQDEDDRFAWSMVILFTILGIAANIAHAAAAWYTGKIDTVQVILAIFATSLFPLSVALVTHLVKRVLARDIARRAVLSTLTELTGQVDKVRAELAELLSHKQGELDRLNGQIEQAMAKLEQLKSKQKAVQTAQMHELNAAKLAKMNQRREQVLNLVREGMNPQAIADELSVSLSTIKRDLAALNGQVRVTL
jgi:DNA-binding NarL/FixJ family response regulator